MTTYNTGNPAPSTDPRDLDDNAQVFDQLMNGPDASYPDRRGVNRKSWQQMEDDASALVSPNVAALAAVTPAIDKAVYFSATVPVTMLTYTMTGFARTLGAATDKPTFRTAIDAAKFGANSDITSLTGLTTPLTTAQGGTGNNTGLAATATALATSRSISATGDGTWSVNFNGTANATGALTLAATGVAAGTYGAVTVNAKGLVTAASVATPIANGGTGQTAQAAALTALLGASAVPIANGGTGQTTAAAALTALGEETAWTNFTLQNSWAVIASRRAAYRKTLGQVQIQLQVSGGTATDGTVVATLPVGFRPAFLFVVPSASAPSVAPAIGTSGPRILINTNGEITCTNVTSAQGISCMLLMPLT